MIQMQEIMKEFINKGKKWLQYKKIGILCNIRKQQIQTLKTLPVQVNKSGYQYMKLLMIHIKKNEIISNRILRPL